MILFDCPLKCGRQFHHKGNLAVHLKQKYCAIRNDANTPVLMKGAQIDRLRGKPDRFI